MEKMTEENTSQREMAKSKWKHLTLRLQTDTGAEHDSELTVTYHTPLLPPADNTQTML